MKKLMGTLALINALLLSGCNVAEQVPVPESSLDSKLSESESEKTSYFRFNKGGDNVSESDLSEIRIAVSRGKDQIGLEESIYVKLGGQADLSDISDIKVQGQTVAITMGMFEVAFSPGMLTAFIEFSVLDDNTYEGNERLTLSMATEFMDASQARQFAHYVLFIQDDETFPKPYFVAPASSAAEGGTKLINIGLDRPSKLETKALIKISGGDASSSDHDFSERYVTFPSGTQYAALYVEALTDALDEVDETLELEIYPVSGLEYPDPSLAKHTLTILASGSTPEFEFALAAAAIAEGSQTTITLNLSAPSDKALEIPFMISGNAHYGSDYLLSSQWFSFAAGQTSASVTFTALSDGAFEGGETATLTLQDQSFAIAGSQAQMDITINDAQSAPTLGFPSALYLGQEGKVVNLPVVLSAPALDDVQVDFQIEGTSTAASGVDYKTSYSGSFLIPAKATLGRFPVLLLEDELFEQNETIILTITGASFVNYALAPLVLGIDQTTLIIKDGSDLPKLSFVARSQSVHENGGAATVEVQLEEPAGSPINFELNVSGGALEGSDFSSFSTSHAIPAGSATYSFVIPLIDDSERELSEKIVLSLLRPPKAELGSVAYHEITIVDDDSKAQVASVSAGLPAINEGENTWFEITLDKPSGMDLEIPFTVSGTASKQEDYLLSASSFIVPAGQTSARVALTSFDDNAYDGGPETLSIQLATGSHYTLGADTSASVAINDLHSPPSLSFSNASGFVSALEGDTVEIAVEIERPTHADLTVEVVVDDNYLGNCNADCATILSPSDIEDFHDTNLQEQLSGGVLTLVIPKGQTKAGFSFQLAQDNVNSGDVPYENGDERFRLGLNSPDASLAALGSADTVEVSIREVESASPGVYLSASSSTASEGELVTFEARLSAPAGSTLTIPFHFSGSAVEGEDFEAQASSFSVPSGADSAKVSVFVLNDDTYEGSSENIQMNLETGSGYGLIQKSASVSISDAQTRPKLSWSANGAYTAGLEGQLVEIGLELETATYKDVEVQIEIDDNYNASTCGASCASVLSAPYDTDLNTHPDFTGGGIITATIPKGEKSALLSFTLADDAVDEDDDERFVLRLYQTDDSAASEIDINDDEMEIRILEDAVGVIATIVPSAAQVTEGGLAWFDVALDEPAPSPTNVSFTFSGDAVENEDFLASSSPLTFNTGEQFKRIYIHALDDGAFDAKALEEIVVTPSCACALAQPQASMKIKDAHVAPKALWAPHLSAAGASDLDGLSQVLELRLEHSTYQDVTYKIAVDENYANNCGADSCAHVISNPSPYDTNLNSLASGGLIDLTILAGETSGYLSFTVVNDADADNENFKLLTAQTSSSAGAIDSAGSEQEFQIKEPDASLSSLSVYPSAYSVAENTATASFEVRLDRSYGSDLCVPFSFSGSASLGTDFTASPTTTDGSCPGDLFIASGSTSGSIDISVLEDGVFEGLAPEEIIITLSSSGSYVLTNSSASLKIEDGQSKPKVFWTQEESLYKTYEGGSADLRISIERPLQENLQVGVFIEENYRTDCNAACADILSGSFDTDLNAHPNLSGQTLWVTIPAGETSAAFSFNALADAVDEDDDERFRFVINQLDRPSLASIDPDDNQLEVAILEAAAADYMVTVEPTSFVAVEGGAVSYFTVSLNQAHPTDPITVPITFSGTAAQGVDYTPDTTVSVTIPATTTSEVIGISAIDDAAFDGIGNEYLQINLSETGGSNNYILLHPTRKMEIQDAQSPPAP